jgi:hypothetical protein
MSFLFNNNIKELFLKNAELIIILNNALLSSNLFLNEKNGLILLNLV